METPARVNVGWALWGKRPGSNDDYSVLASSTEPLSQQEFANVLAHFEPGTPPAGKNLPSSLPWVIISRVGIEDRPYVGIAIERSTTDVDGAGRPITMTSYFCLPFAELSDPPVSYADLYGELASIQLPYARDSLISLSIPQLDPAAVAASIGNENWEPSATAAAAMLLNGPVCITGSEGSTMPERLRYLDAVAAMLPFGYRADFTAATWSDTGARHPIRLVFAAKARDDSGVVQWRSASPNLEAAGPGAAYLRLLRQIRARRTGDDQLAAVIGTFARANGQGDFGHPQAAIESLRGFDFPFIVLTAVLDGTAQPVDIRAVFTQARITELSRNERQTMLGALIGLGDPQDIPAIRKWWEMAVASDSASMAPVLVSTCRRLLWAQAPSLAVKDYLALAGGFGLLDAVLADLTVLPDSAAEVNAGVGAAAHLIADWALGAPQADFPLTRRSVSSNPVVASELLAQLAGSERNMRAVLAWLEPDTHDFLRPFAIVVSDAPDAMDRFQLSQLAQYNLNCVRALLQAASLGGRLHLVLPALAGWLAVTSLTDDTYEPPLVRYWHDQTWALTATDPGSQAWIDLVLLVLGNEPRFLPTTAYGPTSRQYCECFATAWSELVTDTGQPVDDLLTDSFLAYLEGTSWTSEAMLVDAVAAIAMILTGNGRRRRLESAIADALLASPEAAGRDSARGWLNKVRPQYRDSGVGDVLLMLRHPRAGLTQQERAELCARGFREGLDPRDVSRALAESTAIGSGQVAMQLLDEVRIKVHAAPMARLDPRAWLNALAVRFADGSFGAHIAQEFLQAAATAVYENSIYGLDMLYIAATKGRPDMPPELSDTDIANLQWIPRSIDQILKEAKRRPRRASARHGRQERGEADDQGRRGHADNPSETAGQA